MPTKMRIKATAKAKRAELDLNVLQMDGWGAVAVSEFDMTTGRRIFEVTRTSPAPRPSCCGKPMNVWKWSERTKLIVDAPAFGFTVAWKLKDRNYRCARCSRSQVEDQRPAVASGHRFTTRAIDYLAKQAAGRSFNDVANDLGTSSTTVRRIAQEVWSARPTYDFPTPRYLGIDEIYLPDLGDQDDPIKKARAVLVDLESGTLLDILPTNTRAAICRWLYDMPDGYKVRGASMDFEEDYRKAVAEVLPQAKIVIDKYHIMAELNKAFDTVRARKMKERPVRKRFGNKQGTVSPNHKEVRELIKLMRAAEEPKPGTRHALLLDGLFADYPIIAEAYKAKRDFRRIWETDTSHTYEDGFEAMVEFRRWDNGLPRSIRRDFDPLIKRIYSAFEVVFPYFAMPITNGPTEWSNRNLRRLTAISEEKLHLPMLRLKARAYARLKTHHCDQFHCDSCGNRVADYLDKVAPFMVNQKIWLVFRDDPIWLCERCKAYAATKDPATWPKEDIIRIKRPAQKPAIAHRIGKMDIKDPGDAVNIWDQIDVSHLGLPPKKPPASDLLSAAS